MQEKKNLNFLLYCQLLKLNSTQEKRYFFLQHDDLACENLGSDITEVPHLMKSVLSFHIAWDTLKTSIREDIINLAAKMDQE